MSMDMSLPKFGIHEGTGATNCFRSLINCCCPHFFQEKFCLMSGLKFTLSDVTSFLPNNLFELKIFYSGLMQSHDLKSLAFLVYCIIFILPFIHRSLYKAYMVSFLTKPCLIFLIFIKKSL